LVLFAGRLQPFKGPDLAIRTIAALQSEVPDARIVITGGPADDEDRTAHEWLHRLALSQGVAERISVVPAQTQEVLARYYAAANVVLVPSRSESFGLVALEAQACSRPVVASDAGGLPFVVREGETGVLVRSGDVPGYAAAVLRLLRDPAHSEQLGRAGALRAARFSWDHTAEALHDLYAELVALPLAASSLPRQ
jgi:D-inositol-3-phosphate glycosyltransferase